MSAALWSWESDDGSTYNDFFSHHSQQLEQAFTQGQEVFEIQERSWVFNFRTMIQTCTRPGGTSRRIRRAVQPSPPPPPSPAPSQHPQHQQHQGHQHQLQLYPHGYMVDDTSTLLSILASAMPDSNPSTLQACAFSATHFVSEPAVVRLIAKYGMTTLEAQIIHCYTLDRCGSDDPIFSKYTKVLRSRNPEDIHRWRDFSYVFKSALDKLPPCQGSFYRCGPGSLIANGEYAEGAVVCSPTPISVFTDKSMLRDFMRFGENHTIIEYRVRNAKDISAFSALALECERLLPMNFIAKVVVVLPHSAIPTLLGLESLPPNTNCVVMEESS